jgi:hypothetical protein
LVLNCFLKLNLSLYTNRICFLDLADIPYQVFFIKSWASVQNDVLMKIIFYDYFFHVLRILRLIFILMAVFT